MSETGQRAPVLAVTALPGAGAAVAVAAALGVVAARRQGEGRGVVVCERGRARRRPTLVSSVAARELESRLRGELLVAARGAVCWATLDGASWRASLESCRSAGAGLVVVAVEPERWRELVADPAGARAGVVRADLPAHRPVASLAAIEMRRAGVPLGIVTRSPGLVASRRALAGVEPGGTLGARAERLVTRLLRTSGSDRGQALPLVIALALLTLAAGAVLALLSAAATSGSRMQRAADLAAVSAARVMRDDHQRLFVPPRTGSDPTAARLSDAAYRARARAAARRALTANDLGGPRVRITFPGSGFAPTRVRVEVRGRVAIGGRSAEGGASAVAVAEAYPPADAGAADPAVASGGGYAGPLAYRQGKPMRPDVAAAFDRLAAAARRDGHLLTVTSGFRSDAEQAALFAANPDPRWVAPPGSSLHRCATELDLGPATAYAWLDANARRFGFLRRYSWEPWHFGYVAGPAPCARTADALGARGDGAGGAVALPAFVRARFRDPIARAAARWRVSAGLLAAQLLAESGFNPFAVSPAGALGIAQFMPGTAAAYGLHDPFDPGAAIDAQAHLMADLLRRFGSVPLALAAYNAGPAPVAACECVPAYPETQAYVTRVLGLLAGAGEVAPPQLQVRLVR